jgi:copper chaperone CopZ
MDSPERVTVTHSWHVPSLIERPAVGTSCCATTAEALLSSELFLLPGVLDLSVDVMSGRIEVVTDPSQVDAATLASALDDIGYPPDPKSDPAVIAK